MPESFSDDLRINERRAKVAALRVQGFSQVEIAVRLGLDEDTGQAIVSQDLKVIHKTWRESSVRDFDLDKGKALAKLELLEKELWQAWERSKKQRIKVSDKYNIRSQVKAADIVDAVEQLSEEEKQQLAESVEVDSGENVERQRTVEQSDGDPRYPKLILECVREQLELIGLASATGEDSTSPPVVGFRIHQPGEAADPANGEAAEPANGEAANGEANG